MSKFDDVRPEYTIFHPMWRMCNDAYDGQQAIHNGGETYLPRLDEQSDDNYGSYKQRTRWFNATALTVRGYTGLVSRKDPVMNGDDIIMGFFKSVDLANTKMNAYMLNVLMKVIITGRCGTLVDYTIDAADMTKQESSINNGRHVWAFYEAQDILNWKYENGKLMHLSLMERYINDDMEWEFRFRHLDINDGVYVQTLYAKDGTILKITTPKANGKSLDHIPFVFHTNSMSGDKVENSPILDLVNLNIAHYQLKADHRHGLHYVALPTPYVTGMSKDDKDAPTTIGSQYIWFMPDSESKVGLLEFSGQGLASVAAELATIEEQLAQSGARILQPNTEKTATAAQLSSMSETSILSQLVAEVNEDGEKLIAITLEWMNQNDDDASFKLNTDFWPTEMAPTMITSLVSSWQQGAISYEDLFKKLQQGEIIDGEKSYDDHVAEMQNEGLNLDDEKSDSSDGDKDDDDEPIDEDEDDEDDTEINDDDDSDDDES